MSFKTVKPEELILNPFTVYSGDWTLITAAKDGVVNTMTASWGSLGVNWGKNVLTAYIRPQRYTKEFVDGSEYFSVTVFPEGYREKLTYLGTVSGRDQDKIAKTGLTVAYEDGVPYFGEAKLIFFVKKLFAEEMKEENFLYPETVSRWFPQKDFHTIYMGEIVKVLVKED